MTVYEIYEKSIRELDITDKQRLAELIKYDLHEVALAPKKPIIDFDSMSMFDIIERIGYIEATGQSDMARHPEKYMKGFGETKKRRKLTP